MSASVNAGLRGNREKSTGPRGVCGTVTVRGAGTRLMIKNRADFAAEDVPPAAARVTYVNAVNYDVPLSLAPPRFLLASKMSEYRGRCAYHPLLHVGFWTAASRPESHSGQGGDV